MPKSREQVRTEYAKKFGLSEFLEDDHKAVLKISDNLYSRCAKTKAIHKHKTDSMGWMKGRFSIEDIDRATARGECVIDKICILSFPLNDSRTSPTLRQIYLEQEQLMIDLAKIDREETKEAMEEARVGISSEVLNDTRVYYCVVPEDNVLSDTVIAVRGLKDISKENLAISQVSNKDFLTKTLGVIPEGFCTQSDNQLCSECPQFHTGVCQ